MNKNFPVASHNNISLCWQGHQPLVQGRGMGPLHPSNNGYHYSVPTAWTWKPTTSGTFNSLASTNQTLVVR